MSSAKIKSAKGLERGNKENCRPTRPGKNSKLPVPVDNKDGGMKARAKPAPDFSKLHAKWNNKLQMGKACVKKPCTISQEFNLTTAGSKFTKVEGCELSEVEPGLTVTENDRQCFTPDAKSMSDLQFHREISPSHVTGRTTIATSSITTGPKPILRESNTGADRRPPAKRSKPNTRSLVEEQENTGLQFEPDKGALNSILAGTGIDNRHSTITPSKQLQRGSIYYQPQNRVSLFDSCLKKRLMKAPVEVKKALESDRVCLAESPYVKGLVARCSKNSVFPEFMARRILTPNTPKTLPVRLNPAHTAPNTASRVPNPNFKPAMSPNQLSNSVKKIRKTLKWGDILSSPEFNVPTDQLDDVTPLPASDPSTPQPAAASSVRAPATSVQHQVSVASVDQTRVFVSRTTVAPAAGYDSSGEKGMSHLLLNNITSGSGSISAGSSSGIGHQPYSTITEKPLPTSVFSRVPLTHAPGHADSATATTATSVQPGVTSDSVVAKPVSAMIDALRSGTLSPSHPDDVNCQRHLQFLEAKERRLLYQMQQLNMAMSDDNRTDDNDNSHHHHHQHQLPPTSPHPHHQQQQQQQEGFQPPDSIAHHQSTTSLQSQTSGQRPIPHSSLTQGTGLSVPGDINLNLTIPASARISSRQDTSSTLQPLTSSEDVAEVNQAQIGIEQQLLAVQQQQQELLRVQEELQRRLRESQDVGQQDSGPSVQSQEEQNNNNHDLTCNFSIPSGPSDQGPSSSCGQEPQITSGDINDNYETTSSTTSTGGHAFHISQPSTSGDSYECEETSKLPEDTSRSVEGRGSSAEVPVTLSEGVHAGHDQTSSNLSSHLSHETCSEAIKHQLDTGDVEQLPSSSQVSNPCESGPQYSQGHVQEHQTMNTERQQLKPLSSSKTSSSPLQRAQGVSETVRRDSSAPLDLRTPCKLPRVEVESEHTSIHVPIRLHDHAIEGRAAIQTCDKSPPDSRTHATVDPVSRSHTAVDPVSRSHAAVDPVSRMHAAVDSDSRAHASVDPVTGAHGDVDTVSRAHAAIDLSMPQASRPVQPRSPSPDILMPPIWTPLALKGAASNSSPNRETNVETSPESSFQSPELEAATHSPNIDLPDRESRSEVRQGQSSEVKVTRVNLTSVNVVTTSLTSVTLSECSLPAIQSRHLSETDIYLDALLDDECALFTCRLQSFARDMGESERGISDPVARTLLEGDDMHFVPIHQDTMSAPLEGSAFAAYSPV